MSKVISTPMFTEAAQAVSAPCWHQSVVDGRWPGLGVSLAERCAR